MEPKDLKLPQANKEMFARADIPEKIWEILYAVDPALLRRLDRSVLVSLVRINIKYQIAAAELEAQRMQAMADAYRAVDEVLSG